MRIISCHIENFGRLHDFSMEFCEGVNMIRRENGWGKSTFAAFVRAMFYGLEGDRKRSLEENERKRYKPWQGGVFGGQIVFEVQGKTYLISRIFKEKEGNDEFELRDAETNLPSKDYTGKIGEEIFQINRESFMRTIFIGQNQCETSSTDDINAKIGMLADHANDLNHFEAAGGKLTEILNRLNPNRVTGSISKRREEIAGYERLVRGGEELSGSIEEYQKHLHSEEERYEHLKRRMEEAGEKQKTVSAQQAVSARKSEWERLKANVAKKAEEKELIRQRFPGDIPAMEDVKQKISECGAMERAYDKASMFRFSEEEKGELVSLADRFGKGVPPDEEIQKKLEETRRYRNLSREYNAEQLSPAEKERLDELEPCFADDLEYVTSIAGKWNQRNTRKAALPSKQAALMALKASAEDRRRQRGKTNPALLILGVILMAAGVLGATGAFAAASGFPAAGMVSAAGLVIAAAGAGFVIAGLAAGKKRTDQEEAADLPELENLRQAIEEDEDFIAKAEELTSDYLAAHGRFFHEDTASAMLQEITAESIEYASLKKKYQKSLAGSASAELETLRRSIGTFLTGWGFAPADSKFEDDLYLLKNRAERFLLLMEKRERYQKAAKNYLALKEAISRFVEKCGFEASDRLSAQCGDIRDWAEAYQTLAGALEEAEKELGQFEEENNVSLLEKMQTDESLPSLEDLNLLIRQLAEEREETHKKIGGYNSTLENLQEQYDEWEENCAKLEELKELQSTEQKKYQLVRMAKRKLELAKEAMTAKYADPIRQGFCRYYEMISGEDAERFHIDANTAVTVDELGKQRDVNALSFGCRDLIGICLRVALADAMYQGEQPVLIMDDPFTNLDDGKVSAGRRFVDKLGEKRQLIYFTCSASRE